MFYLFLKLDFCLSEIKNLSKLKNKTIFQISSSSWFQKCKKIWKKFIFWRNSVQKTFLESRNLSIFLFKKVGWICIWLCISFKKILWFVLKTVLTNPGLSEAIFWSFRLVPFGLTMFFQTFMMRALIWIGWDHLDLLSSMRSILVL